MIFFFLFFRNANLEKERFETLEKSPDLLYSKPRRLPYNYTTTFCTQFLAHAMHWASCGISQKVVEYHIYLEKFTKLVQNMYHVILPIHCNYHFYTDLIIYLVIKNANLGIILYLMLALSIYLAFAIPTAANFYTFFDHYLRKYIYVY